MRSGHRRLGEDPVPDLAPSPPALFRVRHHDRVWFCTTCKMLEQRLMPVSEVLASVLEDAGLAITVLRAEIPSTPRLA